MNNFDSLGLSESLVSALNKADITQPTKIQEKAIPIIMENKNVLAQSETGSGKTLAYLLPLFQRIKPDAGMQAIILAPTHELASQIKTESENLAGNSGLNISFTLIIGDVNIERQKERLKKKPNIIIGSAGRILELIGKKKINSQSVKTIVIDEADRMLDIKNFSTVKKLIMTTQKDRQLLFFSASYSKRSLESISSLTDNFEDLRIESDTKVPASISHFFVSSEYNKKVEALRDLMQFFRPEKSLVFVKEGENIEKLSKETKYHGLKASALTGSLEKEMRKKVLDDFRKGKIQILFATDIASRGLDIKGVSHVINFDFPLDEKGYLHRCGRTGRQNLEGISISIVTRDERELMNRIAKKLDIEISKFIKNES